MVETGFQTLNNRRTMEQRLKFQKLVHTKNPVYLSKLLPYTLGIERATRASNNHTFNLIKSNTIYFSNSFLFQLNPTQIRHNFSSPNFHLYQRHCNNSPNCSCGDTLEIPHHYFFLCPQFTQQQNILFFSKRKNSIPDQQQFTT